MKFVREIMKFVREIMKFVREEMKFVRKKMKFVREKRQFSATRKSAWSSFFLNCFFPPNLEPDPAAGIIAETLNNMFFNTSLLYNNHSITIA